MKYNMFMKKKILPIIVFIFFTFILSTNVFAQSTGFNLDFTVPNPIKADNFDDFMGKLLEIVFLIAIPIITIFIIYSGFLFVTAQGNAEKIETAKKNFMWVLIGSAILLGSWLLANAIGETIRQTFAS